MLLAQASFTVVATMRNLAKQTAQSGRSITVSSIGGLIGQPYVWPRNHPLKPFGSNPWQLSLN